MQATAFFGPITLARVIGELSIGVAASTDRLRLVATSSDSDRQTLDRLFGHLRDAVRAGGTEA